MPGCCYRVHNVVVREAMAPTTAMVWERWLIYIFPGPSILGNFRESIYLNATATVDELEIALDRGPYLLGKAWR